MTIFEEFPDIKKKWDEFCLNKNDELLTIISKEIINAPKSIDLKREMFKELFSGMEPYTREDAILNMWAVACMLDDDLPIAQKISGIRSILLDTNLNQDDILSFVKLIWEEKKADEEFRDFIAKDFLHDKITPETAKEIIRNNSN